MEKESCTRAIGTPAACSRSQAPRTTALEIGIVQRLRHQPIRRAIDQHAGGGARGFQSCNYS